MADFCLNRKLIKSGTAILFLACLLSGSTATLGAAEANQPTGYEELIKKYAREQDLPYSLIKAIIKTESNFDPQAVSPKGAKGLMQLMPEVCRLYGVTDPFNPDQNIRAGSAYFKELLDRFHDLTRALAAYNGGPEAVDKYGGVPPVEETREFVHQVYKYYNLYRQQIYRFAPLLKPGQ